MSGSIGQLAGGLVGAWVGSFFGMPSLGFSIGSSLFASGQTIKADPGDLNFSPSSYGKILGWGYGTYPVDTPLALWASNFHAIKKTQGGGKGGGGVSQEYYEYTIDIAYHLRDCTDGNPIAGVRRIWNLQTGELLFDVGDGASATTLIQSKKLAANIRLYTGTGSQDPDPLIEAAEGWAPGYRGQAYVVIEGLKCGTAKQVPYLRFEIVDSASATQPSRVSTFPITTVCTGWTNTAVSESDGTVTVFGSENEVTSPSYQRDVFRAVYDAEGNLLERTSQTVAAAGAVGGIQGTFLPVRNEPGLWLEADFYTYYYWSSETTPTDFDTADRVIKPADVSIPAGTEFYAVNGYVYCAVWVTDDGLRITRWRWSGRNLPGLVYEDSVTVIAGAGTSTQYRTIPSYDRASIYVYYCGATPTLYRLDAETLAVEETWTISGGPTATTSRVFWVNDDRLIVLDTVYAYLYQLNADGTATLLGTYNKGSDFIRTIWYVAPDLVLTGAGMLYMDELLPAGSASLANVVDNLCTRAGLDAADHDESLLPATGVRIPITSQQAARDWLQQLGDLYHYRMRTSGGSLQCVPKGGTAVATIEQADLGMRPVSGGAPVLDPPIVTYAAQGIALPRKVTLVHLDPSADYAVGQQGYHMRGFGEGQDLTLQTQAILTADEAKEIAIVSAKEPHLERLSWSTSVGVKWARIEAGDVVDLPQGRAWVRRVAEAGDGTIDWELQAEAASAYTGQGLPTASPPVPGGAVALSGPTKLALLDPPALLDIHTGGGYVVAACGYLSGWTGCNLYASDDGETFDLVASITEAAVIGVAETALGDHNPGMWDTTNSVVVRLVGPDGSLASATQAAVRQGSNWLMWGSEIVGVADVAYLGNRRYQLDTLLRGRRGTEWATSGHAKDEAVVLLSTTALQRLALEVARIGTARQFKAVSFGNSIADVQAVDFTPAGVSLEPWSPVFIRGTRDASGNLNITWQRRSRFEPRPFWRSVNTDLASYEVDIMSGATVLRTLTSTSETVTYTTTQMSADGVTPHDPVSVEVYQLSADVARGYAGSATV